MYNQVTFTLEYINKDYQNKKISMSFIDLSTENQTACYFFNKLPDAIKNDIYLRGDITMKVYNFDKKEVQQGGI